MLIVPKVSELEYCRSLETDGRRGRKRRGRVGKEDSKHFRAQRDGNERGNAGRIPMHWKGDRLCRNPREVEEGQDGCVIRGNGHRVVQWAGFRLVRMWRVSEAICTIAQGLNGSREEAANKGESGQMQVSRHVELGRICRCRGPQTALFVSVNGTSTRSVPTNWGFWQLSMLLRTGVEVSGCTVSAAKVLGLLG